MSQSEYFQSALGAPRVVALEQKFSRVLKSGSEEYPSAKNKSSSPSCFFLCRVLARWRDKRASWEWKSKWIVIKTSVSPTLDRSCRRGILVELGNDRKEGIGHPNHKVCVAAVVWQSPSGEEERGFFDAEGGHRRVWKLYYRANWIEE